MSEYEVSVRNTFEADSLHDAVDQMCEWLAENGKFVGYRVEDGERTYLVDGWQGGVYQLSGPPDGEHG